MTVRPIKRFPYHDSKLEPFRIEIKLMLAVILAGVITESETNKQTEQAYISPKTKNNFKKT